MHNNNCHAITLLLSFLWRILYRPLNNQHTLTFLSREGGLPKYLSYYWPTFDNTLKVGFWDKNNSNNNNNNILVITDLILTKL